MAAARSHVSGLTLETFDVIHSPGSMPTGIRLSDGKHIFAYSGDTAWTETLNDIAADADLFLCECSSGDEPVPYHLHWPLLKGKLKGFNAKRIAVTHMGPSAIAKIPEMQAAEPSSPMTDSASSSISRPIPRVSGPAISAAICRSRNGCRKSRVPSCVCRARRACFSRDKRPAQGSTRPAFLITIHRAIGYAPG